MVVDEDNNILVHVSKTITFFSIVICRFVNYSIFFFWSRKSSQIVLVTYRLDILSM